GGAFKRDGIIAQWTDQDWLALDAPAGPITITLDPARYSRTLNAILELRSGSTGATLLARSESREPHVILRATLPAKGRYFLLVRSGRHQINGGPWTSYGEV